MHPKVGSARNSSRSDESRRGFYPESVAGFVPSPDQTPDLIQQRGEKGIDFDIVFDLGDHSFVFFAKV